MNAGPRKPCPSYYLRLRAAWGMALLLCVAAGVAACVSGAASVNASPQPLKPSAVKGRLPVQLVETVPVETALGNPALPQAKDVWREMIRSAQRSIDVEGFYLSTWPHEPLEPVLAALGDAGRRGVRVRLLFDRGMVRTYPKPLDSLATLPGVTARAIDMRRIAGGVQHSKYFLVDGEQVYLGSQNFDWRSLKHIHEMGVWVRDKRVARTFADVFEWDWSAADTTTWRDGLVAPPHPDSTGALRMSRAARLPVPPAQRRVDVPIRIVQTPGDTVVAWPSYSPKGWIPDSTRWDQDAIVSLLDGTRHEIVLQLLTYAPEEYNEKDETLDRALRRAAARGARVKLLIADWVVNGHGIRWLQELAQVPNVEVRLSTLPDWSGGYIPFARVDHCKYAVADTQTTWVGTANWGPGYFYGSRNLALTMRNRPLALDARRVFESGWSDSTAKAVRVDYTYPEKLRGMTPPPGKTVYGN